jgi:hypothetical protein
MDREGSVEGPPKTLITVEAMNGKNVKWTFKDETPNIYTHFSLVDGRKVRTNRSVELSADELEALDSSLAQ